MALVANENITVVHETWRPHPLAWIHRAEALSVAEELRRAGYAVQLALYLDDSVSNLSSGPMLLRLSDPVMRVAVQALTRAAKPFIGPSGEVMERCYDKYEAHQTALANGVDSSATALAGDADGLRFPLMLKPRRGSDSIGVRLLRIGAIPDRFRSDDYIAQEYVRGAELTIGVLCGRSGMPLHIVLPEGRIYSFARKYLLRPRRTPVLNASLAERVRGAALKIVRVFGVNWAARIDLIHETATDRLCFLECDVAPLIGARSAFAASFEAAGIDRAEQLRLLLKDP
jgi:D-alanine-D-alanine ligase-like ATP-grasp enzyme